MELMELPVDTLVDILLRLPVKEVACVKCVSKTLSKIVSDISFSKLHSRLWPPDQVPRLMYCSSTKNLLTLQSLNYKDNILTKGKCTITVSSSDRGYVRFVFHNIFCLGFSWTDCMLMNVLGERGLLRLPECSFSREKNTGIKSMSWFGMGFDDKTNTYKIVCVTHDRDVDRGRHTSMTAASVLELGTNSWRQITSLPPCELNWMNNDVVCANGAAHWLTRGPERDHDRIVSFDFRKEEFCWTPTPPTLQSSNEHWWDSVSNLKLLCLKGCLAIVGTRRSWSFSSGAMMMNIEVWVLKDSDQQEKLWEIYYNNKIPYFLLEFIVDPPGEWEHGIFYTRYNGVKTSHLFIDLKFGSFVDRVFYPLTAPASSRSNGELEDLYLGTFSYPETLISLKDYGDLEDTHYVII